MLRNPWKTMVAVFTAIFAVGSAAAQSNAVVGPSAPLAIPAAPRVQQPGTVTDNSGAGISAQQPGNGDTGPGSNLTIGAAGADGLLGTADDTAGRGNIGSVGATGPDGVLGTVDDGTGPGPGDPGAAGPAGMDGVLGTSDDALGRGPNPATGAAGADGVLGTADDVGTGRVGARGPAAGPDGVVGTADDPPSGRFGATGAPVGGGFLVPGVSGGVTSPDAVGQDINTGTGGAGGVDSEGGTDASDRRVRPQGQDTFDALDGVSASGTDFDSRDGVGGAAAYAPRRP